MHTPEESFLICTCGGMSRAVRRGGQGRSGGERLDLHLEAAARREEDAEDEHGQPDQRIYKVPSLMQVHAALSVVGEPIAPKDNKLSSTHGTRDRKVCLRETRNWCEGCWG